MIRRLSDSVRASAWPRLHDAITPQTPFGSFSVMKSCGGTFENQELLLSRMCGTGSQLTAEARASAINRMFVNMLKSRNSPTSPDETSHQTKTHHNRRHTSQSKKTYIANSKTTQNNILQPREYGILDAQTVLQLGSVLCGL